MCNKKKLILQFKKSNFELFQSNWKKILKTFLFFLCVPLLKSLMQFNYE